jgi:hypothetical protein
VKIGSLIRNKPTPPGEYQPQLFEDVWGDWFGIVIDFIPKNRGSKYNLLKVLLTSHGGVVGKSWLMDGEISDDIEVLSET